MVHVGVEHCDFAELATQHLGGDCGVVQEAEATCGFGAGMVPWWPAQGISGLVAFDHRMCRGHRALRRPVSGLPGVLADRAAAIGQVAGGLAEDAAQGVAFTDVDVGHHLIAPVFRHFVPLLVGAAQVVQVCLAMHGRQRGQAVVGGFEQWVTELFDYCQ
ncbi:hypothetical protein D3C81_1687760 [compost metagenome]